VSSIADRVALLSFGAINLCMIAYMKTVTMFSQERPVVRRESVREQYSAAEYLAAKALAEMPLDCAFAAVFTAVLKAATGLRISWNHLTQVFSLLTVAGASLGFLLGSLAPTDQYAASAGIPVVVIMMVVGVINPSGVDPTKPPPALVKLLKQISPFSSAIEALCLAEYPGVKYHDTTGWFGKLKQMPRMGGLAMVKTGDQVIKALGLADKTYAGVMEHLATLSLANWILSWLGLLWQQRRTTRLRNRQPSGERTSPVRSSSTAGPEKANAPLRVPPRVRL
jgi:hypothetical protein